MGDYLAIIPARSGSKRIPDKNTREIAGKRLIEWTLEAAASSRRISDIAVSTDSPMTLSISLKHGALKTRLRDAALAGDSVPTVEAIRDLLSWQEIPRLENIVVLQATSPLRNSDHIDAAIDFFESDSEADSLVSCTTVPHAFHPAKLMTVDMRGYVDQSIEPATPTTRFLARNGPAIIVTRRSIVEQGSLYGEKTLAFEMEKLASVDIDDWSDFMLAESLLINRSKTSAAASTMGATNFGGEETSKSSEAGF